MIKFVSEGWCKSLFNGFILLIVRWIVFGFLNSIFVVDFMIVCNCLLFNDMFIVVVNVFVVFFNFFIVSASFVASKYRGARSTTRFKYIFFIGNVVCMFISVCWIFVVFMYINVVFGYLWNIFFVWMFFS